MSDIFRKLRTPLTDAEYSLRPPGSERWETVLLYLLSIGIVYYMTLEGTLASWQIWAQAILLPLVVASVVFRRRLPYALPLLGLIAIPAGTLAAFLVGLVSLAVRVRGWSVWVIGAVGCGLSIATVLQPFIAQSGVPSVQLFPLLFLIICVVPVLIGSFIRRSREREAAATTRAIQAEIDREVAAARAVNAERDRIAQEMHDSLGHVLTLVTTQAGALEVSSDDPATRAAAESIRDTARRGLADLRSVVRALGETDPDRQPIPTLAAVPELIAASRSAGASVEFDDQIGVERAEVDPSISRLIYRILQESLTNAHRHAPGAPVRVSLSGEPGSGITVNVSNPLAPGGQRGSGTGLDSIRSRVEVLGGNLEVRSSRGTFELLAQLPWEES